MTWNGGKVTKAVIKSKVGGEVNVKYNGTTKKLKLKAGQTKRSNEQNNINEHHVPRRAESPQRRHSVDPWFSHTRQHISSMVPTNPILQRAP